jgi:hypothetical protein
MEQQPNLPTTASGTDNSGSGSGTTANAARFKCRRRTLERLLAPAHDSGLGYSEDEAHELIASAAARCLRALYDVKMTPEMVSHEYYWLVVWRRVWMFESESSGICILTASRFSPDTTPTKSGQRFPGNVQ